MLTWDPVAQEFSSKSDAAMMYSLLNRTAFGQLLRALTDRDDFENIVKRQIMSKIKIRKIEKGQHLRFYQDKFDRELRDA